MEDVKISIVGDEVCILANDCLGNYFVANAKVIETGVHFEDGDFFSETGVVVEFDTQSAERAERLDSKTVCLSAPKHQELVNGRYWYLY
jgi:hypothetical protein